MTLSIALVMLSLLEYTNNAITRFFTVYGKVPMFYYLVHIYVIHITQVIWALIIGIPLNKLSGVTGPSAVWGFDLPVVYLVWVGIVAVLYFPCRWFMKIKERRKDWWLSYI